MNCANHPDVPVAAYCQNCGKPLCTDCMRSVAGVVYCEPCLAARLHGGTIHAAASGYSGAGAVGHPGSAPAGSTASGSRAGAAGSSGWRPIEDPARVSAPGVRYGSGASPVLAGLLGVIPGVGAMYNGQFIKALAHVVIFVVLIGATDHFDMAGFLVAAWVFYQIFDAIQTAIARRDGQPLPDPLGLNDLGQRMGIPATGAAGYAAGGGYTVPPGNAAGTGYGQPGPGEPSPGSPSGSSSAGSAAYQAPAGANYTAAAQAESTAEAEGRGAGWSSVSGDPAAAGFSGAPGASRPADMPGASGPGAFGGPVGAPGPAASQLDWETYMHRVATEKAMRDMGVPISTTGRYATVPPPLVVPQPYAGRPEPVGAIVLIAVGMLFLLSTLGVFRINWISHSWPLLIIVLGAWLLFRRVRRTPPTGGGL